MLLDRVYGKPRETMKIAGGVNLGLAPHEVAIQRVFMDRESF